MTREEALERIKARFDKWALDDEDMKAIQTLIPELTESKDEKIRKELIEFIQWSEDRGTTRHDFHQAKRPAEWIAYLEKQKEQKSGEDERIKKTIRQLLETARDAHSNTSLAKPFIDALAWLEKQKENTDKEYVFRPLAGTDINSAVLQAIRRADEGDRLVLAFNGAYIPVRKGCNANKIVDIYDAFIEKQKDASKAIEAVDKIDKYIDEHLANAHDMKDSNPDKKYYRGWDDALGEMARILQDVYSSEKQKEQNGEDEECTDFTIYYPLKNGKGEYECIPYSFYDSLTFFSEDKDLIDFHRACFYTEEECNEWIEQHKEEEGYEAIPVESTLEYKLGFKAGKESEKQKEQRPEWNEEDENVIKNLIELVEAEPYNNFYESSKDTILKWLKSPHPQKLDVSKLENYDPVEVLNKIKTEWPMAWEKVVGKQEWSEEDYIKQRALIDTLRGETTCFTTTDFISWLKAIPLNRKKHNEDVTKLCSNEWSEEDERLYKCVLKTLELWAEGKLYQYIIPSNTDRYIDFFKSLKFRVQSQPKQEWSKKDEEMLWNIISIVGQSKSIKADEMLDWLKSVCPQYHGDVTMTEAYKMGLEAGKASSWKPNEKQTNNVIVELTRIELGDIINGLYYLKEKYYEDCKEHNGTATVGLSDEFKFYFKRFNEALDLYTRLHELEKERYGTTTDGYYYE